ACFLEAKRIKSNKLSESRCERHRPVAAADHLLLRRGNPTLRDARLPVGRLGKCGSRAGSSQVERSECARRSACHFRAAPGGPTRRESQAWARRSVAGGCKPPRPLCPAIARGSLLRWETTACARLGPLPSVRPACRHHIHKD